MYGYECKRYYGTLFDMGILKKEGGIYHYSTLGSI